ncbi:MAG: cytochrome C biogenesis protein, partial [Elusimicrobia bacterium]|nr:cytochrome C biogenesis protein [Elusimicrobiota bacterium]MBD3412062.1 cytochrome C biogenesis protein [Elusimicrobiota bacterium]
MEYLINLLEAHMTSFSLVSYVAAFAAGVLVSFTPCVYPLVPVTVAFIGGQAGGSRKKTLLYSTAYILGIAIMYAIFGAVAAVTGSLFGRLSTSPITQFIVANVFILMGLSMLDVWQIPTVSIGQRFKTQLGTRAGIIGSLVFGMASGTVFAPCTAPVLGVLLVMVGTQQNIIYGISVLFVYSLGMSTLLFIAGLSAGFLTTMPKAGKWTVMIKKAFGWLMIFMGEYFLINT